MTPIRLSIKQAALLRTALEAHEPVARAAKDYEAARICRHIRTTSLHAAPYDLALSAPEWRVVSRALRYHPGGNAPRTIGARCYSLYLFLNRKGCCRPAKTTIIGPKHAERWPVHRLSRAESEARTRGREALSDVWRKLTGEDL